MSSLAAPGIDREVYPMPMFVTLPATGLAESTRWYEAVGFVILATMPGPAGPDSLVHLRRLRYQDLLLIPGDPVPAGHASPSPRERTTWMTGPNACAGISPIQPPADTSTVPTTRLG